MVKCLPHISVLQCLIQREPGDRRCAQSGSWERLKYISRYRKQGWEVRKAAAGFKGHGLEQLKETAVPRDTGRGKRPVQTEDGEKCSCPESVTYWDARYARTKAHSTCALQGTSKVTFFYLNYFHSSNSKWGHWTQLSLSHSQVAMAPVSGIISSSSLPFLLNLLPVFIDTVRLLTADDLNHIHFLKKWTIHF